MQRFKIGQAITVQHLKPWKPGKPIEMRGRVLSYDGDRLVLHREFRRPGQTYDSLNAKQRSGDYGTIELRRGGWIARRRYYRRDGTWIGDLYNIQSPAEFHSGLVRYVDLEVDVSSLPGPPPKVAIEDAPEFDRAVARGHIPRDIAAVARHLADRLVDALNQTADRDWLGWLEWDAPSRSPSLVGGWWQSDGDPGGVEEVGSAPRARTAVRSSKRSIEARLRGRR